MHSSREKIEKMSLIPHFAGKQGALLSRYFALKVRAQSVLGVTFALLCVTFGGLDPREPWSLSERLFWARASPSTMAEQLQQPPGEAW